MIKKILVISLFCLGAFLLASCGGNPPINNCKDGMHENLEWVIVEDSTCSKLGRKEQQCTKCHAVTTTAFVDYKLDLRISVRREAVDRNHAGKLINVLDI